MQNRIWPVCRSKHYHFLYKAHAFYTKLVIMSSLAVKSTPIYYDLYKNLPFAMPKGSWSRRLYRRCCRSKIPWPCYWKFQVSGFRDKCRGTRGRFLWEGVGGGGRWGMWGWGEVLIVTVKLTACRVFGNRGCLTSFLKSKQEHPLKEFQNCMSGLFLFFPCWASTWHV